MPRPIQPPLRPAAHPTAALPLRTCASAAVAALLLAGCVTALPGGRPNPVPGVMRAQGLSSRVEANVDKERLGATLAKLAGKAPMAPGVTIPERGTVDGRALTRRFIGETLTGLGYQLEKHTYRQNGENLIVRLPAEVASDEWILVGAHMDSVRNAGADDNGSGSTAVLELATVMKGLAGRKVNVMFAWFDEEELGLVGSYAMARDFKKQGVKLASVHTCDMIGYDADDDRTVEIEQPDANLWDYYKQVNETHGLNLPLKRTSSGDTDHVAFRQTGFTSVGLCEEWVGGDTTPYYHRKTDTFETIDLDYLTSTTKLMAAAVSDLARKVPGPAHTRFIPHSQFPGRPRPFHGGHEH